VVPSGWRFTRAETGTKEANLEKTRARKARILIGLEPLTGYQSISYSQNVFFP
jgi:hypothetical protein